MTKSIRATVAGLAHAASLLLASILVVACSGAVTDNTVPATSPITVSPATATLYSGMPATFIISGGNGSFLVTSSDQVALPASGNTSSRSLTVVPGSVSLDTAATLTVRDSAGTQATAAVTVKPRIVSNVVSIIPTRDQCAPAICSGDDALAEATIVRDGLPVAGRAVRFEVISGDFSFITGGSGSNESRASTVTVATDSNGKARARFRVNASAESQTALMRIVDVSDGSSVQNSFSVNGTPTAPTVIPEGVTFRGPYDNQCIQNTASADFFIFGGVPPYSVSNTFPGSMIVSPTQVFASGGNIRVTVFAGACFENGILIITDAAGQRTTVTVDSLEGSGTAPVIPAPLVVSPNEVTLATCSETASATLAGGDGTYSTAITIGSPVLSTLSNDTVTVRRTSGGGTPPSFVNVQVFSGNQSGVLRVNLIDTAAQPCT